MEQPGWGEHEGPMDLGLRQYLGLPLAAAGERKESLENGAGKAPKGPAPVVCARAAGWDCQLYNFAQKEPSAPPPAEAWPLQSEGKPGQLSGPAQLAIKDYPEGQWDPDCKVLSAVSGAHSECEQSLVILRATLPCCQNSSCLFSVLDGVQWSTQNMKLPGSGQRCYEEDQPMRYMQGDVEIGFFLPIFSPEVSNVTGAERFQSPPNKACRDYRIIEKNYQQYIMPAFTLHEINRNPNLLPNISLGYRMYNSYSTEERTLQNYLLWLSGTAQLIPNYNCRELEKIVAVIGGATSSLSVQMGTLLDLYHLPQIIYGPFDRSLTDKVQFPSLYQMAHKSSSLHRGIVRLLVYFQWNWIGLIVFDDVRGEEFLREMREEMKRNRVCVSFTEKIPLNDRKNKESAEAFKFKILISEVKVIVIHTDTDLLTIMGNPPGFLFPTKKVWIATSHSDTTTRALYHYGFTFHASLFFSHLTTPVPGFESFIRNVIPPLTMRNVFLEAYRPSPLKCSDQPDFSEQDLYLPNASLKHLPFYPVDMTTSALSYNIYNAFYAAAWALHEILMKRSEKRSLGNEESILPHPWQVPSAVCSASCPAGFTKLPLEGKPPCCFSCSPCSEGEISSHINAEQCKKCPEDKYPSKQRDRCLPKTVTFLDVNEPWGKAVTAVAVSLSLLTALVLWVFVKFQDTPIVQANNRNLSYMLLTSLSFCFLCSLLFLGSPTTASCLFRQTVFAVVFTVAVSSILAKTIIVVLAFRVTGPGSRMRIFLHSRMPYCVVLICFGIQVLFCAIWLGTHPPFPEADTHSESSHIILTCNEGSTFAFYCVLGYMGFLALASFTIAFLARNLPDAFNEAKFITFSMLIFCSVWISFLPTYQSSKGKAVIIVEIFSILASSAGLLGCIFIPKCFVILLSSWENNTKQNKNQRNSRSKNFSSFTI
ncbi:vomeronasal type-2 receptor 26-like [Sminthopsis crassicaudata]|uniref:vomeronasal type-2 receptor 26-like n=1 Tax=Sminthopsis crassicaudata TaxID=9301 RepID=UPI003D6806EE